MDDEPKEGWVVPKEGMRLKVHYGLRYSDFLLCWYIGCSVRWIYDGEGEIDPDWPDDHPDNCKTCVKRLKRKRDKEAADGDGDDDDDEHDGRAE